jgi:hypothetical protein
MSHVLPLVCTRSGTALRTTLRGHGRSILDDGNDQGGPSAQSDLEFLVKFRDDMFELFVHEGRAAKQLNDSGYWGGAPSEGRRAIVARATEQDPQGYQTVRQRLAVGTSRAVELTRSLGVPAVMTSYAAPAVGAQPDGGRGERQG